MGMLQLHRSIRVIGAIRFIGGFARFPLMTLVTLYYYYIFDLSYLEIGIVFTLQAAFSVPANLYGGYFADRIGRRRMILLSSTLVFLASLALFFISYLNLSVILFITAYIAMGIGSSVQRPVVNSTITDLSSESDRVAAFSLSRITSNAGIGVGLIVAGFSWGIDPVIFFLVNVAGAALETLLFLFFVPESFNFREKPRKEKRVIYSRDRFLLMISSYLAISILFSQQWLSSIFPLYITGHDGLPVFDATLMYSFNTAVIVVFQPAANRFLERIGEIPAFVIGTAIFASGYIFFGLTSSLIVLFAVVFVISIGEDLVLMIPQIIVSRIAPMDRRGEYFGTNSALLSISFSLSPIVGTSLLYIFTTNQQWAWYVISIVCFITLLFSPYVARKLKGNLVPAENPAVVETG